MKPNFNSYKERSFQKRSEILTLIKHLGLELKNKEVLELGCGYGDFLDICYEQGAKTCNFIERDEDFYAYNKAKHFITDKTLASKYDYLEDIDKLNLLSKFDLLYSKGGFSIDELTRKGLIAKFLLTLTNLASTVIITPHWENSSGVRKIEKQQHSEFYYLATNNYGFTIMPFLEGYNTEPQYNLTFIKNGMC